jgi:hypothetical protein
MLAWGPAARKFSRTCTAVAGGDRDIDLYHCSTPRFSPVWQDTLMNDMLATLPGFPTRTLPRGVRSERRWRLIILPSTAEACLGDGPSRALGLSGRMARPNATTCS